MSPKKADVPLEPPTVKLHKTVIRSLSCRLTDPELLKKGAELAATVQDLADEEKRQNDVKAQLKAKVTELEARRSGLAITVSRKEEHRDVEVDIYHDYVRGIVEDIRRDTGEIVHTRPMSEDEKQLGLPMEAVGV
jgi:hypothetical protein